MIWRLIVCFIFFWIFFKIAKKSYREAEQLERGFGAKLKFHVLMVTLLWFISVLALGVIKLVTAHLYEVLMLPIDLLIEGLLKFNGIR